MSSAGTTARTFYRSTLTTTACQQYMIQQNLGNTTDFFRRSWAAYKAGFGDTSGNYWIGNDRLYTLTSLSCSCSAQFYGETTAGIWYYQTYQVFSVGDEVNKFYQLTATGPGGNGSDALKQQLKRAFSTYDNDNDADKARNCADLMGSGWWFGEDNNPALGSGDKCGKTNINANATFFAYNGNPVTTLQRSVAYITCV